ncbi:hypothetical protein DQ238_12315 [Geodermatophilus sp. TF02-6]|uniref:GNAT family N-acetyltransferase n=1 Tax=Geodermatophilus sp. TF02-6 TaxID=2250575 RepID=UPI000DEAEE15|nr:GNAT family N-acetyltransferase [Geodermatophilus sp. TF02-6]RBY78269.1 hypothetical protein DQ238_12315 [Geodermatophilus sp. TF02-6]
MQDADLPQLLRLWEEAGWGVLTTEQWRARHRHAPHGPSRVAVAVAADGTVVGQVTALRTLLNVHGTEVAAARVHGAIVSPDVRRQNSAPLSSHPVLGMLLSLADPLSRDGVAAVYVVPNARMLALLPHLPQAARAGFPLWSRPLGRLPAVPAGYDVDPAVEPGDVDALWERCRGELVCTVRDARTLSWKALFAPVRWEGVRRGGELVAIVTSRRHGDRQWLLEDLLAVDHEARVAAIAAVVRTAHRESAAREIRKVGALAVPALQPALAEAGFAVDDFAFHLLVHRLDDAGPPGDLDPARWYLTPND